MLRVLISCIGCRSRVLGMEMHVCTCISVLREAKHIKQIETIALPFLGSPFPLGVPLSLFFVFRKRPPFPLALLIACL
jgi:hypothetical protein